MHLLTSSSWNIGQSWTKWSTIFYVLLVPRFVMDFSYWHKCLGGFQWSLTRSFSRVTSSKNCFYSCCQLLKYSQTMTLLLAISFHQEHSPFSFLPLFVTLHHFVVIVCASTLLQENSEHLQEISTSDIAFGNKCCSRGPWRLVNSLSASFSIKSLPSIMHYLSGWLHFADILISWLHTCKTPSHIFSWKFQRCSMLDSHSGNAGFLVNHDLSRKREFYNRMNKFYRKLPLRSISLLIFFYFVAN